MPGHPALRPAARPLYLLSREVFSGLAAELLFIFGQCRFCSGYRGNLGIFHKNAQVCRPHAKFFGVCQVKCVSFLLAVFVTADFI